MKAPYWVVADWNVVFTFRGCIANIDSIDTRRGYPFYGYKLFNSQVNESGTFND